jgi:hypothetical protein
VQPMIEAMYTDSVPALGTSWLEKKGTCKAKSVNLAQLGHTSSQSHLQRDTRLSKWSSDCTKLLAVVQMLCPTGEQVPAAGCEI